MKIFSRSLLVSIAQAASSVYDTILPGICVSCGGRVGKITGFICQNCYDAVANIGGRRIVYRKKSGLSKVIYLYTYDPWNGVDMGAAVRTLKYAGYRGVAVELAEMLKAALNDKDDYLQADLIAPVPLHRAKHRERGFNQSELIARSLSPLIDIPFVDALKRIKNTGSQTELLPPERELNVKGAFKAVDDSSLEGARIILLDDQVTTGATMNSAAIALLKAGAEMVLGLSVTH